MSRTVIVTVHLKDGVRDPAGEAVEATLTEMGLPVGSVRIGRQIVLTVEGDNPEAVGAEAAQRLLANPVLETFRVEVAP
jgi:phosphoribosylformylglycinamidine synthase PurS subunit